MKTLGALLFFISSFSWCAAQKDSTLYHKFILTIDPVQCGFGEFGAFGEYFYKPDKSFYGSAGVIIPFDDNRFYGTDLLDIPRPWFYKGEVLRFGLLTYKPVLLHYRFHGVNFLVKYMWADSLLNLLGYDDMTGSQVENEENQEVSVLKIHYVFGWKYVYGHFNADFFFGTGILLMDRRVNTYYQYPGISPGHPVDFTDNKYLMAPSFFVGVRMGVQF